SPPRTPRHPPPFPTRRSSDLSIAHPKIVTALSLLIALFGVNALLNARLDVFPDFAPPHVLVQTEAPGLDATQVEALVTRPLEGRSEEHTSELQSPYDLVCRLL